MFALRPVGSVAPSTPDFKKTPVRSPLHSPSKTSDLDRILALREKLAEPLAKELTLRQLYEMAESKHRPYPLKGKMKPAASKHAEYSLAVLQSSKRANRR